MKHCFVCSTPSDGIRGQPQLSSGLRQASFLLPISFPGCTRKNHIDFLPLSYHRNCHFMALWQRHCTQHTNNLQFFQFSYITVISSDKVKDCHLLPKVNSLLMRLMSPSVGQLPET